MGHPVHVYLLDCGQVPDAGRDVDRLRVALLHALQYVPQLLLRPDQRLLWLEAVPGWQFSRKKFGFSFGWKSGFQLFFTNTFWLGDMPKISNFKFFLSEGNL